VILTTAAVAAAVAAPFAGAPVPTFTADTFRLNVLSAAGTVRHVVLGPERLGTDPASAARPDVVVREDIMLTGRTATTRGVRLVNRFAAAPDGSSTLDDLGFRLARFLIADARAGRAVLTPTTLAGRAVFRAEVPLTADRCRDLEAGTATVWLTRTTLLPRRLEVERGDTTRVFTYRFERFNETFPLGTLRPPALGPSPQVASNGFLRRSPRAAAGPLPFTPRLPTVLPSGFRLVTSGWAEWGARTGPGGVNPRDPFLFAAVYARGWERIELTQRVAANGTWARNPFGQSCRPLRVGRALVGTRPARYGIGPEIPSHLWWRDGGLLLTVSGPYGKADLVTIAASLRPAS
jgi:hypothetical protein